MLQSTQIKRQIDDLNDMIEFARTQSDLKSLPVRRVHDCGNDYRDKTDKQMILFYIESVERQISLNLEILKYLEVYNGK